MKPKLVLIALLGLIAASLVLAVNASAVGQNARRRNEPGSKAVREVNGKWEALIDSNRLAEARSFCTKCVSNKDKLIAAEGHKCLANVELATADTVVIDAPKGRAGSMRGGYRGSAVDTALAHLKKAMNLSPGDISIHQGRLHVLIASSRFSELAAALEESIAIYPKNGLEDWLTLCPELVDLSHYEAGLEFTKVLEKHYPSDHRVLANVGAMLALLERDAEAVSYLKKAIELKPDDPINNWNLGRLYDYTGKYDLADQFYRKSISVEADKSRLQRSQCVYSQFLETRLGQTSKACELQKQYCSPSEQTACKPKGPASL